MSFASPGAAARPPDRADRVDRLPPRPAAPLPLCGPLHQRGPAGQHRAAHAQLGVATSRPCFTSLRSPRWRSASPGRHSSWPCRARRPRSCSRNRRSPLHAGHRRRSRPRRRTEGRDRFRGPAPRAVPGRAGRLLDRCAGPRPADDRTRRDPRSAFVTPGGNGRHGHGRRHRAVARGVRHRTGPGRRESRSVDGAGRLGRAGRLGGPCMRPLRRMPPRRPTPTRRCWSWRRSCSRTGPTRTACSAC